ncbi:krueppel-like factor 16 [Coprinopsis cinerea AmutBmut pab1-1]|nr:krueppel-like factor 16 [Coprinopsis cinerea AmutBmut pab1-1]
MTSPDHHNQHHHRAGSVPYDHSSPSSNGDNADRRSRASSVSSAYQGQQQQQSQFGHSPRLDVAHSFENMTVRSPNWGTEQLPPQQKPHSPPRLLMPDTYPMENQDLPSINAPDGDGVMGGPQLHIVPATPVGAAATNAPFQNNVAQGAELGQSQPNWGLSTGGQQQSGPSEPNSRQPTPFRFPAQQDPSSSQSNVYPASNDPANFLFPQQQRTRSKSDNALEPPSWDQAFVQQQQQQQLAQGDNSALGLDLEIASRAGVDDGLGTGSSTTSVNVDPNTSPSFSMQNFTFGGSASERNNFLSPDAQSALSMRRTRSEQGNGRPLGHRQSRSEDIRGLQQQQSLPGQPHHSLQPQLQQQHPHPFLGHSNPNSNFHHGHSLSLSASQGSNLLFPPPTNDFGQMQNPNLLSTHHTLPSLRSLSPGRGHIRRASSGSRSERGIGAEPWGSSYSGSARASPYPSPNASPRVRYDELELDLEREAKLEIPPAHSSAGFENEVALSGRMGLGGAMAAKGLVPGADGMVDQKTMNVNDFLGTAASATLATMNVLNSGGGEVKPIPVSQVSKPNVTTLRTATASHKRRKQEAGFVCPFPGCGSTFTRSFNLKGHIRSHNEEKPFVCHWPGCGKGFARQHDCKRHEQLHTNYRPFTCEGCNRQFARMDALNRHLRSEGGAECAKQQQATTGGTNSDAASNTTSARTTPAAASPSPKVEAQSPPQQQRARPTRQNSGQYGVGWGVSV